MIPSDLSALLALSPEKLTPEQVHRLGRALGGLAPWWLRPDVLERFEEERGLPFPDNRTLPRTHGSCWVLLVQRNERVWPALRDAFFLPVQWRKGSTWDERLPEKLQDLAKELAVELDLTGYGLHLHPIIQQPPALPSPPGGFEFGSAAISLAGGLYLAARDGEPDPTVAASACWEKAEGVRGVDLTGLKKKLALAAEWGVRTFFVAKEQVPEATGCAVGIDNICGLPQGRSRLETAIQEFAVRQKAEPAPPASLEDEPALRRAVDHWAFLPVEHKADFYQRQLWPWVLTRFADLTHQESEVARAGQVKALVTIVSGQKDTTILAARALSRLGVRDCMLLYSKAPKNEQERKALEIKKELAEPLELAGQNWEAISCSLAEFDSDERLLEQLARAVRDFCGKFRSEELLLDITGGKTLMKWVADHAMPVGSWRFCLDNDGYLANRPKPLTERARLWRGSTTD